MISRGIVRYYSLHLSDCMCWFVPTCICVKYFITRRLRPLFMFVHYCFDWFHCIDVVLMGALHLHFYSLIKLIFFRILFKFMWDHTVKAITGKIQPFDILYFRSSKVQFSAQVKDFFRPKWNSNPPKWKMPVLIRCDSLNNRNKQK